MGNDGASTVTAKPDKTSPPSKEQPPIYPYPDWAAMQAYYGPGMIPPPYYSTAVAPGPTPHPYMWGPQPMMPPFGAPYAVYPHAHPSMPFVGHPMSEKDNKNIAKKQKEINGFAVSDSSVKSRSSESDDANNKNEENGAQKRKQISEGDPISENKKKMKASVGGGETSGSSKATSGVEEITVKPLAALTPPPYCSAPINNGSAPPSSRNGISDLWCKDEREMKREKRKQSNRESARRSRLRKQAETEELAVRVESLTNENNSLRSEINRLTEDSDKLRMENSALLEKLNKIRPGQAIQAGVVVENFLSMIDKQKETLENAGSNIETLSDDSGKIHQLLDPVAAS